MKAQGSKLKGESQNSKICNLQFEIQ